MYPTNFACDLLLIVDFLVLDNWILLTNNCNKVNEMKN